MWPYSSLHYNIIQLNYYKYKMKTNINLSEIFDQQIELDKHIHSNHHLSYDDIFEELKLALAVELGELANEVRCFKF